MQLNQVPAGRDIPNDFNVIIEIPANAAPIKYELDKRAQCSWIASWVPQCSTQRTMAMCHKPYPKMAILLTC